MNVTRAIGITAALLVGVGLLAGFLAAGSPERARQVAIDRQRVSDLQTIARTIGRGPAATAPPRLPANGARERADGTSVAADPVSRQPYEYERIDATHYRLCATFDLPSQAGDFEAAEWKHGAGRRCFERSTVSERD